VRKGEEKLIIRVVSNKIRFILGILRPRFADKKRAFVPTPAKYIIAFWLAE